MSRPNAVSLLVDERALGTGPEPRPESSVWWAIVLTLAEIAEIVERRQAEEHAEDVA